MEVGNTVVHCLVLHMFTGTRSVGYVHTVNLDCNFSISIMIFRSDISGALEPDINLELSVADPDDYCPDQEPTFKIQIRIQSDIFLVQK
jgi:hypothetical protein